MAGGLNHYSDVIIGAMASQITSLAIVYSTIYSGADQRKHQSSASHMASNAEMFPFDDFVMLPRIRDPKNLPLL